MVRIQGHDYRVIYDDSMVRHTNQTGVCNVADLYIKIDSIEQESQKKSSFCHELFEAIDGQYRLGLDHGLITLLGNVWHQIISDNPKIFTMALPKGDK